MGLDELVIDPESISFLEAIERSRRSPRLTLQWEPGRIEVLRRKAAAENIVPFEKSCALGQLAAIDGDIAAAEAQLLSTLRQFKSLYPRNSHFWQHVLQLALSIQALDLVALFLNERYETPDLFVVAFEETKHDPAINRVTVDDSGKCHFMVDPRIPGKHHADYFVAHWVSSAPLWASYCRSAGWEPGTTQMNSGEAGVIPGVAYCGNRPGLFLIPDAYFLGTHGYADLRRSYDANRLKWEDRQPVAFWRGGTTGVRTGQMHWQSLPRIRLCQIAEENATVLDAGISAVVQTASESDKQQIEAAGLVKGPVPVEAFLSYKYQIDIDGNSNAWPGLYQRLLSGSPVLKVASPHGYRQWYYDRLRPWVNYVPVSSDMTDLIDKIEWLRTHDEQARAIGEAGLALAHSLGYEQEVKSAHDTIRAAFRSSQVKPNSEALSGSSRIHPETTPQPAARPAAAAAVERMPPQQKEGHLTSVRDALVRKIYRGIDPFVGLPQGLYAVDHQGWNSHHSILTDAAKRSDPIIIVEIGVWKGGSTMTMANAIKAANANGVVIAVDTWLGSADHWTQKEYFADLAMDHGYPSLVRKFMNNVVEAGLSDYVLPVPLDSLNAAHVLKAFEVQPDVIHLDAAHEYAPVLADIKAWWPLLKPGGLFIGDDYNTNGGWPGVRQAFDEFFAGLGIKQVEHLNGKCWITK
jgi:predicted O-methyltransferase YrrM